MAITKTGNALSAMGRDAIYGPMATLFTGMGVASGNQSVGEAVGMGVGGTAGWQVGSKLTKGLKKMPGKLGLLGKGLSIASGLGGSMIGAQAGGSAGKKVPIWQRGGIDKQPEQLQGSQIKMPTQYSYDNVNSLNTNMQRGF